MSSLLIPRPIRDIVMAPFLISSNVKKMKGFQAGSAEAAIVGTFGGGAWNLPLANGMIKACARTALAGLAVIALSGKSLAVAAIIGSFISMPATVIVGGAALLLNGYNAISLALATGSLISTGSG